MVFSQAARDTLFTGSASATTHEPTFRLTAWISTPPELMYSRMMNGGMMFNWCHCPLEDWRLRPMVLRMERDEEHVPAGQSAPFIRSLRIVAGGLCSTPEKTMADATHDVADRGLVPASTASLAISNSGCYGVSDAQKDVPAKGCYNSGPFEATSTSSAHAGVGSAFSLPEIRKDCTPP